MFHILVFIHTVIISAPNDVSADCERNVSFMVLQSLFGVFHHEMQSLSVEHPGNILFSLSSWSISPAVSAAALCCCGAPRLCRALSAQTQGQIVLPALPTPAPGGTVFLVAAFTVLIRQTGSSFLSNLSNYPGFQCIWLHTYRLFPKGKISTNYS